MEKKQISSVKNIGSTMPILSSEFADDNNNINIEKTRNILTTKIKFKTK